MCLSVSVAVAVAAVACTLVAIEANPPMNLNRRCNPPFLSSLMVLPDLLFNERELYFPFLCVSFERCNQCSLAVSFQLSFLFFPLFIQLN